MTTIFHDQRRRFLGATLFFLLLALCSASAQETPLPQQNIVSPDGRMNVTVTVKEGCPRYEVSLDGQVFVQSSPLGLKMNFDDLTQGLTLTACDISRYEDEYDLLTTKQRHVKVLATEGVCHFEKDGHKALDIIFRVTSRDVAYRYRIYPRQGRGGATMSGVVECEASGFVLPKGTTTFLCPQMKPMTGFARTAPSYETGYTVDDAMGKNGWGFGYTFPCLFKTPKGWVLISETGTDGGYVGCRLVCEKDTSHLSKLNAQSSKLNAQSSKLNAQSSMLNAQSSMLYKIAFPLQEEMNGTGSVTPLLALTGLTPWRTITIGNTLAPIVETTIANDLVKPKYKASKNYTYGKGSWSWIIGMDPSCNFDEQKRYIDFSAAMGYRSVLVDALWDTQIGYEKMEELARYGREKGVGLFLWYNSNGSWNDAPQGPRGKMDKSGPRRQEMAWMQKNGILGIKVDFFGGDKQQMMQLYEDILTDANDFGIQVIFHGCTLPRGWERMYPNFVAAEAVLASENLHFGQGACDAEAFNACLHPFIRNTVASMDFGGSALNKRYSADNQHGTIRKTSDVFAMATAVLFQSSVQHFALAPNNLYDAPKWTIRFMKDVPTLWDETRFIDGYPGKYIILARRSGDKWYIAGVTSDKTPLKEKLDQALQSGLANISLSPKLNAQSIYTDSDAIITVADAKEPLQASTEVSIEFVTPGIVHVVKGHPTKSRVVIAKSDSLPCQVGNGLWKSNDLTIRQDAQGRLTFLTAKGKVLLREKDCDVAKVRQTFTLDKDEAVYGLGTIQNGKLNRRGEHKRMEQSNLEDFQNVLQSVKGWGLYWENYSPTQFDDDASGMTFDSEAGEGIDYYFMYGGSADGVIAQMRHLTGDVPMFPLWTYGFWQSKERYKSAAETESIVDQYRALQVPLDGIIQDWQYWGPNYLWNAMDFLSEDFATGPQMIENVHKKHAHFMISIWASFGPQTQQFHELNDKGLLLPFETWPQSGLSHIWPPRMDYPSGVKVYDAFSPVARDIYWKHLKRLYDYGTDAWWMDSTDPDFFNPRESDYAHPVTGGTWRSLRNAFPLETVRGVYQAQRKEYSHSTSTPHSQKRVFIMTRSSFAGQQHYGSNMWSGDVNSSWDMLRKQVPAGLSFSLTGNPNFNTDIGGFFCNAYNTRGPGSAPQNPQFQELYVRWMQYGLFCPVFRSHGADAPREIWQFGKKGEPVYDAIEKMIRLRYRLIPYLYSTAWQVTSGNESYLRPLFSDFAADRRVWNMGDEFMFGRSILATPILDPQYTEEKIVRTDAMTGWDRSKEDNGKLREERDVDWTAPKTATKYLPKGALWYDFWTNKTYKGGQTVTLTTTLDRVPMFVRAGSILPLGPEMQYVAEKAWDNLEIRVYPGADGTFTLYEDEGDGYDYEKGYYATITFQWNDKARQLTIGTRQGGYQGMILERQFTIVLPDGTSRTISHDGNEQTIQL